MIRAILTIGLLLFALPAYAEPMTLAKHYRVNGKNPDGSSYVGTADVDIISDTTFSIVWKIAGSTYKGFGMRMNESISATYMLGNNPGLVMYRSTDGGNFTGLWAIKGQDGSGTETLSPTK